MKNLINKTVQFSRYCAVEMALAFIILVPFKSEAGNSWSSKKNFGGGGRAYAVGFIIGNKAYVGTGLGDGYVTSGSGATSDFWELDESKNVWTQKADYGGGARIYSVGFAIGNKGYLGTGEDGSGNNQNDFWQYDTSQNKWTQKSKYPGGNVKEAVGFSIGSKGYVGIGIGSSLKNAFYEYDTSSDSWAQKANFGGSARQGAVGFSIGSEGYIGTGFGGLSHFKDFWQYDPSTDKWGQKADFGGGARAYAIGFSIGSLGYLGTGVGSSSSGSSDFWEYNPVKNTWTQKTNYGDVTYGAVGFSNCTNGFIGTGINYYNNPYNYSDFEEYTPSVLIEATISANKTVICPGGSINFSDSSTNGPTSWRWTFQVGSPSSSTSQNPSNIVFKNPGNYKITLTTSNGTCSSTASQTIAVDSLPTITAYPASSAICPGSSAYLYVTGANKYSWSPGTGLSSTTDSLVTAKPTSTTAYTVTGTSAAGCTNTAKITVTVNPKPNVSVSPTSNTICSGDLVSLSASGASSYFWSPSTGLNATKGASVNATPSNTITYTVTGTDFNGCTNTATVPITVNALPNANAGHDVTICGGSVNLLASGGTSYSWDPTAGLSCANCPDPVASPGTTTKYTVTVTDANGCSKNASVTVSISTHITASAGSDSSICDGGSTMLSASGGTGYSWLPAIGLSNPKIANPIASPNTTTTYTVTVTSGTCTPDSDDVTVTVNQSPPIPTITANVTTLKSSSPSGNQWYLNGNIITGATSQFYTITENGFYSVCVTNANGCSSCSQDTSTTRINENPVNSDIAISQNPTSGKFTLNISQPLQRTEITIYDIIGRPVYCVTTYNEKTEIDLTSQPKGTYVLKLRKESGIFTKKVVIE